jgi:hypothetical protein
VVTIPLTGSAKIQHLHTVCHAPRHRLIQIISI